jgi:hypothetical protein
MLGELVLVEDENLAGLSHPDDVQVEVGHRHFVIADPPRRRVDVAVDLSPGRGCVEQRGPPLSRRDELRVLLLDHHRRLAAATRERPCSRTDPDAVLVLAEVEVRRVPVQAAVVLGVDHADVTSCHDPKPYAVQRFSPIT